MKQPRKRDDDWATPQWFLAQIRAEFGEFFDPCPYQHDYSQLENDGIYMKWGSVNFLNPPYEQKAKEAFVRKALLEKELFGNTTICLLPVSTSTKLFHDVIKPFATEIRFLRGRIKFEKKDPDGVFRPRKTGQGDSMLVIFDGRKK